MRLRLIGLVVGLVYAVLYGFWTMMATGGGHGNFTWLLLFCVAEFLGLFFPIMGFLVVNLRPFWAKVSCGVLLSVTVLLTAYMLVDGLGPDGMDDIIKSWNRDQIAFIVLSVVHFAPLVVIGAVLLKSIFIDDSMLEEKPKDLSIF